MQNFPNRAFSAPTGPEEQLTPTRVTPERKGPEPELQALGITPPPPLRLQPIKEYYANKSSCPSQSGATAPSPQRPLSPQQSRSGGGVSGNRSAANFPLHLRLEKKNWFLGVTWERSGRVWPGRRRRASAVALGAFPVTIRNRLEMLSNLPRPHFASGKQKSSGEQTTFEYFLQASRLQASGLCFLSNTLNSQ